MGSSPDLFSPIHNISGESFVEMEKRGPSLSASEQPSVVMGQGFPASTSFLPTLTWASGASLLTLGSNQVF
jgi:hypothetical protein